VEIRAARRVCAPSSFFQGDHPAHEQETIERDVPLAAGLYIFSDEGPTDHFCTRMWPLRFLGGDRGTYELPSHGGCESTELTLKRRALP
jgi:hypothetical protein